MGNKTIMRNDTSCLLYDHKNALLFLFLLISAFVAISIVAFAHAEETSEVHTSGDFQYVILDEKGKTGSIYKYSGDNTVIEIPDHIAGISIIRIENEAFSGCTSLQSIAVPNGVMSIGSKAFWGCSSLQSITLPDSLISIGTYAFTFCYLLNNITIPESVTSIGYNAFEQCTSLESIAIPESVTCIKSWTFKDCNSLSSITLPNSLTSIEDYAFWGCTSLKDIMIPSNVTFIGNSAFEACSSLESITIPSGVTSIENYTFDSCSSLSDVSIPIGVTNIGAHAFRYCNSLEIVVIPNTVISIGNLAFENNALKDVYYLGSSEQWKTISGASYFDSPNVNVTVHFLDESSNSEEKPFIVNGHKYDHNLEYYVSHVQSSFFDNSLCQLMCGIAMSAYDRTNLMNMYSSLGFDQPRVYSQDLGIYIDFKDLRNVGVDTTLEYAIGIKAASNGTIIVLIDIRGTKTIDDWLRDAHVSKEDNNYSFHSGFKEASEIVYDSLVNQYGVPYKSPNTKYFITGHSLGAAVSNLLSTKLSSLTGKEHVYCYDFACPDTVAFDNTKGGDINPFNPSGAHSNIFNICNDEDLVTYLPGIMGSLLLEDKNTFENPFVVSRKKTTYIWGKNGITKWFYDGQSTCLNSDVHEPDNYLRCIHNSPEYYDSDTHPNWQQESGIVDVLKHFRGLAWAIALCPVDIKVLDGNGQTIAHTEKGVPYNDQLTDCILMVSGDKKAVCYPATKNYSIDLVGTDLGKMLLLVGESNGDIIGTMKAFEDVKLTNGKTMVCDPIEDDIEDSRLFVINSENEPVKEIHEDGTEAKIGVTDLNVQNILIERDEDDFVIKQDTSKQIKAIFKNAEGNVIEKAAVWTSSNEQIATVSETGLVAAISEGKVTITVSVDDQTMEIPITVSSQSVEPITEKEEPTTNKDNAPSTAMLNGIVKGADGKWAMYKNNKVDTSYTGIAKNQYGWWRIEKGYVNFKANGIYKNQFGWWKTTDGKVTFKETGVFKNEYGWWRVENSKVNFKANGIYKNQYGWWKTTDGKVTFKENGVFKNEYGWWKVKDSKVDFNFTGIAKNEFGRWYVKNGKVDFNKNGKVTFNNQTYTIKGGRV